MAQPPHVLEAASEPEVDAQQKIPTMYPFREFAAAGGLMSYGTPFRFV